MDLRLFYIYLAICKSEQISKSSKVKTICNLEEKKVFIKSFKR